MFSGLYGFPLHIIEVQEATELCGYRSKHWQQRDVGVNVVCTKHNNGLILDKHPPNHFKIL